MGGPQDCQTKKTAIGCNAILKGLQTEIWEPEKSLALQETCKSLSYLLLMHLKTSHTCNSIVMLSRKTFPRHLRYQFVVAHCSKIHTVQLCRWRTKTIWKQNYGSNLMEKLVLTMGVWQGTADSLQSSILCSCFVSIENGFAFCLTRYSTLIMVYLSMQQGILLHRSCNFVTATSFVPIVITTHCRSMQIQELLMSST